MSKSSLLDIRFNNNIAVIDFRDFVMEYDISVYNDFKGYSRLVVSLDAVVNSGLRVTQVDLRPLSGHTNTAIIYKTEESVNILLCTTDLRGSSQKRYYYIPYERVKELIQISKAFLKEKGFVEEEMEEIEE